MLVPQSLLALFLLASVEGCIYRRDEHGVAVSTFSYTGTTGPLGWAHLAPSNGLCSNGTNQSPIAISSSSTPTLSGSALPVVTIPEVSAGEALLENLGSTLEVVVNGTLKLDGVDEEYKMAQFHFHTPSEHRIDEEYFPLEMHMVFKSASGGVAVIGVPFDLSDSGNSTSLLTTVFAPIASVASPGSEAPISAALNFDDILSAVQKGPLYSYSGSLTTPPCTQGVKWMVLGQPLDIDVKTYKAVKGVLKFNSRYTQNAPGEVNLVQYAGDGTATNSSDPTGTGAAFIA
ncbi:carbonic anhydrase [Exidia glandulosa HHB12029]|uniref:Carbonic anhydrase n=1 Tax=Exidia glandulosa HHB12029 TaxID=1314781 RepID=A0A165BWZ8_EXIGL|nr:carbonic anhydrase [Exidia glandulosa HHB12029]